MVMERLTNKAWRNFEPWEFCGQGNFCARECNDDGGCNNGCIVPKLYSRLASIEEILGDEYDLDHLRNLLQAENDGPLSAPPCKVGDKVYQTDGVRLYESTVRSLIFDTENVAFDEGAIGKTVFLTREEAEAVQKGGEG